MFTFYKKILLLKKTQNTTRKKWTNPLKHDFKKFKYSLKKITKNKIPLKHKKRTSKKSSYLHNSKKMENLETDLNSS